MKCSLCHKVMDRKVDMKSIFKKKNQDVCKYCFMKHMNHYPYFVIPINQGVLHVFELLKEVNIDYSIFNQYFYAYYKAYLKTNQSIDAIYIDVLNQSFIHLLDQLEIGNLIIFTNIYKED